MSRARRLHLDEVITSLPELGPTIPDGGFSWVILGVVATIQMTVPSILSMYGVALEFLVADVEDDFNLWTSNVILTPILFLSFWSLTDPWSRTIVSLASIPRLVGIIGVILISIGVLASGYLATGGSGAYMARLSAGAVMGIGASLVVVQSENMLRRHFRSKLAVALTLRNIAFSLGLVVTPGFVFLVLSRTNLRTGLLLISITLIPTLLGVALFRAPTIHHSTPYTLLLGEEDNELSTRDSPDVTRVSIRREGEGRTPNPTYTDEEGATDDAGPPCLFGEGSNSYSYEDPEGDVNLFVTPAARSVTTWKEEFQTIRSYRFWAAVAAWIGMKASSLSFFILLPPLAVDRVSSANLAEGVALLILVGFGTLGPTITSRWSPKTARWRSLYFGGTCWLGSLALVGLLFSNSHVSFVSFALIGGISIGGTTVSQEFALRDAIGARFANRAHTALSTVVGFSLLLFSFIQSVTVYLRVAAAIQLVGGIYWVCAPLLGALRAR